MESAVNGQQLTNRSAGESERLRQQHELVKSVMGGKLVQSPVDLARPGLRVLDSGTAQALWPLDLIASGRLHATADVVGTDIAPQHFPPANVRPSQLTLASQSVFEPWPAEWRGAFDLVHQRFVLAVCSSEAQAINAVSNLFSCVAPGGYLELHEGNMMTIREGPAHPAMTRFRDVAVRAWASLQQLPAPGCSIAAWLRDVGAVDVYEETQILRLGAEAESDEERQRSMVVLDGMIGGIKAIAAGKERFPSKEEYEVLEADLRKELLDVGNYWQYHLAYGRKPE
ncbi:hypothetical protein Micbo1qcDRAFT_191037 [Microdochium bolleyi]|uniref:S-adenosyl-L-methionine-dependent methyltransferase n=1 Tax=Microdochium bolleyi TaxID=196109 RepID=A0A136IJ96_9PEZI|nr:hypothetical protein Micbo1qcDRAFT_191037 [Microdochium bolleyi]